MGRFRIIPPWLRRGLEAGLLTAALGAGTLLGLELSGIIPSHPAAPSGATGPLALALPVLAVGVLAVAYPVALAATRSDAVFGAVASVLISADLVTLAATSRLTLSALDRDVAVGALAAVLAGGPAVVGLVAGQLTPLGFGRQAGFRTTVAATAAALLVLVAASRLFA